MKIFRSPRARAFLIRGVASGTVLAAVFLAWAWSQVSAKSTGATISFVSFWRDVGLLTVFGTFGIIVIASLGVALIAEWKHRRDRT